MTDEFTEVSAEQLIEERTSGEGPVLLDVREEFEWQAVRIPGCLLIPMNQIPERISELQAGQSTVVICAHGHRSLHVLQFLQSRGFNNLRNLNGGMAAWEFAKGEIESGD